jgi:hypothetical protein
LRLHPRADNEGDTATRMAARRRILRFALTTALT